ncbi:conserved hypothetical protein [Ricinus communis]|uniref:Uncharacterized protein n=1 Tax=Ricinus communis TaxID=3988 RepID=B9TDV5_RICCO|nr:conserved hypothetical protein [Ricinus communis]
MSSSRPSSSRIVMSSAIPNEWIDPRCGFARYICRSVPASASHSCCCTRCGRRASSTSGVQPGRLSFSHATTRSSAAAASRSTAMPSMVERWRKSGWPAMSSLAMLARAVRQRRVAGRQQIQLDGDRRRPRAALHLAGRGGRGRERIEHGRARPRLDERPCDLVRLHDGAEHRVHVLRLACGHDHFTERIAVGQTDQLAAEAGRRDRLRALRVGPRAGRRHHRQRALRDRLRFDAGVARVLQRQREVGFAETQRVHDLARVEGRQLAAGLREIAAPYRQRGGEHGDGDRRRGDKAYGFLGAVFQARGQAADALQITVQLFRLGEQAVRFRLRNQLAPHALEQGHAQLQLRMLQDFRHGRLRNVQHLRGAADGADLHDGVKDFDMAQAHRSIPGHCCTGTGGVGGTVSGAGGCGGAGGAGVASGMMTGAVITGAGSGCGSGPVGFVSASSSAAVSTSGLPSMLAGRYFIWKADSTVRVCSSSTPDWTRP